MQRGWKVAAAVAMVGAYGTWCLTVWWASAPEETWDSYRYLGAVFDVQNPGILTTLLYTTVQDARLQTLVQVLVSAVAWSLLALGVLHRLRGHWPAWVVSALVLLISLTAPLWSWNMMLATESLAITASVLWLASIVWLADDHHRAWVGLTPITASAAFAALARPQLLIVIVPVQGVLLVWWARREQRPAAALAAGGAFAPFIAFAAVRLVLLANVPLYRFRYALNNIVDKTPSFRAYALETMPPCDQIPAALNGPAPWNDIQAMESTLINQCPETYIWLKSEATSLPNWSIAVPADAIRNFTDVMPGQALTVWSSARALPNDASDLLLRPSAPWWWILLALAIGVAAAAAVPVRPRITLWGVLGIGVCLLSVLAFLYVTWGADGFDVPRHLLPALPMLTVAALVLPSTLPPRAAETDRREASLDER
jgi:hypothetical protein